jgi:predicted O-methyltransferase YrrM
MSKELWSDVDSYISSKLAPSDAVLDKALTDSEAGGLPAISVTPNLGKLLAILAQSVGAKRILEIGTLGGYSTIWLARALPVGGRMTTLEVDAKHANVARANLKAADLDDIVDVRVGSAIETLPKLEAEGKGPFDFIFIDADKKSNPDYFAWAVKLSRKGSMIVVDNVIRDGAILNEAATDENIQGVRRLYDDMASDPRVSASAIQTVGSKGYDGFAVALVTSNP